MQRIIENFPEFKKGERNTTKHFTLLEELKKIVDQRGLYDISELEQEIVSGPDNKNKNFKAIQNLIEKEDSNKLELLRLVMLYTLRYENDEKSKQLRQMLKSSKGMAESKLCFIECLLDYAGKSQRKGDLFKESSMQNAKKFLNSMFGEDVKNVLL